MNTVDAVDPLPGRPGVAGLTRRSLLIAAGGGVGVAAVGLLGGDTSGLAAADAGAAPSGLLTDLLNDALGVAPGLPALTWVVAANRPSTRQVAYQVQVAHAAADLATRGGTVWDSGRVASASSVSVRYAGPALEPATAYYWRVRTWSGRWSVSDWSAPQRVVTAAGDTWTAEPIWAPSQAPGAGRAAPGEPREWAAMRTEFVLPSDKRVGSAFLYATGRTPEPSHQYVYRAWVNGEFAGVGPARAKDTEARYAVHDVTALLKPGPNALAALCWTPTDQRFQAQLVVIFTDGSRYVVGTSAEWQTRRGGRWLPPSDGLNSSYYTVPSENIDARYEPIGWRQPGFDDSGWQRAEVRPTIADLRPTQVEPITCLVLTPTITQISPGVWRVDMGREIVGGIRLAVTAVAGQSVEVRLGEELQADGRVRYQLRTGIVYRETWRLRDGAQTIEHWGYRGFRWAELITDPALDLAGAVHGIAQRLAWRDEDASFTSSDPDLDRVWQLCRYSVEATRLDVYQDTPTRERGPYEGDALIAQLSEYYTQRSFALPRYSQTLLASRPTWPTEYQIMGVLLAWQDYLHTGDASHLATDYDIFVRRNLDGHLNTAGLVEKAPDENDLVDWPPTNRDDYVFTRINTVINAWQYAAYAALARVAAVLGRAADATLYAGRAETLRAAINATVLDTTTGRYLDGAGTTHTAQQATAFPTALGVANEANLAALGDWLSSGGVRVSVYGVQFLLDALYRCGRGNAAHALMTSHEKTSWLHMVDDLGATISMEAWDPAITNDLSFSHVWGSAPANVVGRRLVGVEILAPGAALVRIAPQPGPLRYFRATVPTIRGPVQVDLDRRDGFYLGVTLPPNMDGQIELDLAQLGIAHPASIRVRSAGRLPTRTANVGRLLLTQVPPGRTQLTAG